MIIEISSGLASKEFTLYVIFPSKSDRRLSTLELKQYVFRKLNKYYEKTHEVQQFETEIAKKAAFAESQRISEDSKQDHKKPLSPQITVDASKAQAVIMQRDAQIKILENENQLLRALATIGIITNTYVHEIRGSTNTSALATPTHTDTIPEAISVGAMMRTAGG